MADPPRPLPPRLAAYAARLLAGTGLSAAAAARAAGAPEAAAPPGAAAAVQALRAGWAAALTAGPEPKPAPETEAEPELA